MIDTGQPTWAYSSHGQGETPRDPDQLAKLVVDIATGYVQEPEETPQAVRAKNAGQRGGPARAAKLTSEQRTDIARRAASARCKKRGA